MEIQKVEIPKLLTLSKSEMKEIALEIIQQNIRWQYNENPDDKYYWLIVVAPDGEIYKPTKEAAGHPALATLKIYPNNMVLRVLYNYFYPENPDDELLMSVFMTHYGYFNISGNMATGETKCLYNPEKTTPQMEALINSIKEYAKMIKSSSPSISGIDGILLSKKVPYFREKILDLTQGNSNTDIEEILKKRNTTLKEFLAKINDEYENGQEPMI